MKRFWTEVAITPDRGVALDGRPVRTPGRVPLILPTDALAVAVALAAAVLTAEPVLARRFLPPSRMGAAARRLPLTLPVPALPLPPPTPLPRLLTRLARPLCGVRCKSEAVKHACA